MDSNEDGKNCPFPTSKRIHVQNTSSLVDLKAELFKRKQAAAASKAVPDFSARKGGSKWKEIAAELEAKGKDKELKRLLQRREECERTVAASEKPDEELEKSLLLSRQALERKSKLYEEKMQKALSVVHCDSDEDEDEETKLDLSGEQTLVNFNEKVLFANKMKMLEMKSNEAQKSVQRIDQSSDNAVDKYEDTEDWVEYTDSLGRTRKCLKQDLEYYKSLDVRPNKRHIEETINNCVSVAESEDSSDNKPKTVSTEGPIHYQTVRNDEVRDLGVGYFAFSTEDKERKQQFKMLNNLRNQTQKQRELRLKIKQKKQEMLNERLAKVAKRRGIELKPKEENNEESEPMPSPLDMINRLINDARHESIVMQKMDKIREWDEGKINDSGKILHSSQKKDD